MTARQDGTINILIGGEAGQGLVTLGQLLSKSLTRAGYHIHVTQDYQSRIRGGHNTFAIRTGSSRPLGPVERVDVLVALAEETLRLYRPFLSEGGVVVHDKGFVMREHVDEYTWGVPFRDLSPREVYDNTSALGVIAAILGLKKEGLERLVRDVFKKKGEEIIGQNLKVLDDSYEWGLRRGYEFDKLPEPHAPAGGGRRVMMDGNEAIAMGALAAGCNFCSYYPMTPSTSIALTFMEKGGDSVVVEQVEDEIAAVNMALGASWAGARPLVTTSGGGFALMVEGLSLAGMLELPVVIALGMRPGPATGLPTRTEQGELMFAIHSGHGEFPRAVYAPGSLEQCFRLTHEAFDVAERFQTPAIVLTDQYLADSYRAVEPFDFRSLPAIPGPLLEAPEGADYVRYRVTESGVSPRATPTFSKGLVVLDSDEHYENGHITEDFGVRRAMVEKRLRKGDGVLERVVPPDYAGPDSPELLLASWGSSWGPVEEAAEQLRERGVKAATLHFSQVWPLRPEQFMDRVKAAGQVVCVEGNATGQFAGLLRREAGLEIEKHVRRYDGLPFTASYVLKGLEELGLAGGGR